MSAIVRENGIGRQRLGQAHNTPTHWTPRGAQKDVSTRVLARALAATVASLATLMWLAGCATDRLVPAPPKGVDLTGEWQLNLNLSDDPQKPPPDDTTAPSNMRHRGGRSRGGGGGGGGLPQFGNPAGAGGRSGGTVPNDSDDLTNNSDVGTHDTPYVRTLWQIPGGGAGPSGNPGTGGGATQGPGTQGAGAGPGRAPRARGNRFGHWLDAPDRMTIQQSGGKLTIQSKASNGEVKTDEFVSGHAADIAIGQNTADRDVGWRGNVFVVDTKVKSGPTMEQEYALDDDGRLIVSTLMSGGSVPKVDIKRVYDRVSNAQGVHQ